MENGEKNMNGKNKKYWREREREGKREGKGELNSGSSLKL